MNDRDLDAWFAGLNADTRAHVQTAATVAICLAFSDQARERAREAEGALVSAMNRAERAHAYLKRTTATLEQAIQLHAMGRR